MLCSADSTRRNADQPIDGREPGDELPPDDDAARVGQPVPGRLKRTCPRTTRWSMSALKSIRSGSPSENRCVIR